VRVTLPKPVYTAATMRRQTIPVPAAVPVPCVLSRPVVSELIKDKEVPVGISDRESPQPLLYE